MGRFSECARVASARPTTVQSEWAALNLAEDATRRALIYARTDRPNMARDRIEEANDFLQESISIRKRSILRDEPFRLDAAE